jgi:CPA1 family monovalent cation:H+ antiporter
MAIEDVVIGEALIQENLKQFLLVLSVSLGVAALSRTFSQFREIPYTLLLVLVGLGLALFDVRLIDLSPEVTLFIFLPPLVFRTAWNLEWSVLKRDLVPIGLYATVGVAIAIAGMTLALTQLAGFSLPMATLVGASLSATAPAPMTALFRELGVKHRLTTLMEGENLFNSAAAIAAFILLAELPAQFDQLSLALILGRILAFIGIGLGVGGAIGLSISYLLQRSNVRFLGRSLILVAAYGTYLLSEEFGGSGIVGVVVTGLVMGNYGARGLEPSKRLTLSEFLGFLAFFVNSIVFLVIGDQIRYSNLIDDILPIGVAIGAMLLTRAIAIYGLGELSNWLADSSITWQEETVLWWTGLRGSVSIALALSVPIPYAHRDAIVDTVFGVVLFTLLFEGLTTKWLLKTLGFLKEQLIQQQYLLAIARSVALNQVLHYLTEPQTMERWKNDPKFLDYQKLVSKKLHGLQQEIDRLQAENPQLPALVSEQLREELITMESSIYAEFVRAGLLNRNPTPILQQVLQREKQPSL